MGKEKWKLNKNNKSENTPSGGAGGWKAGQGCLQRRGGIWGHLQGSYSSCAMCGVSAEPTFVTD